MIRFKRMAALAVAAVIVFLTGCNGIVGAGREISVSDSKEYFGTIMTITLKGTNEKELISLVSEGFEEIHRLENIFSAKKQDSELSRLNRNAFNGEVTVSDELLYVLKTALEYNRLSKGALDVSIGNVIDMWGIGTDNERIPAESELAEYMCIDGCQYIVIDENKKTVRFLDSRIKLDLGAIAKGYAADRVKEYLLSKSDKLYGILNFGGNIMTIKTKKNGDEWNIGITDPLDTSNVYGTVALKDECVVTSGNYERYFIRDNERYHHILNPKTCRPAKSGIISATIAGSCSIQCDALSTACFILGVDEGMKLIESIDGVEAVFVDDSGKCYTSSGMDRYKFKKM